MGDNPLHARILEEVGQHANGVSTGELESKLSTPRRTLQAALRGLVGAGHLERIGAGPSTRYRAPTDKPAAVIVRSHLARELRDYVRRPLQRREPVGYQRALLDDYRPNESAYLSRAQRDELHGIGARPEGDQEAGTYARRILGRLLIDLSWASSRLEGNTYSLLETQELIEAGRVAEGKEAREAQMILNHKAAIEFLVENAAEISFDPYTVRSLHALLSDNLLGDPAASGRLRHIPVRIAGSVFHPLEGPQRIEDTFRQVLDTAAAIEDPIEQSFFALVHLPYLQPFDDVNKRVSRLAANIPLVRRNLCPLSFIDVPTDVYVHGVMAVYERAQVDLLRDVFVWAYRRSAKAYAAIRRSLGEPDPFRLVHRALLRDVVGHIVREAMGPDAALRHTTDMGQQHVEGSQRERFARVVRAELAALHEGNIARFRVRPSEYARWRARQE